MKSNELRRDDRSLLDTERSTPVSHSAERNPVLCFDTELKLVEAFVSDRCKHEAGGRSELILREVDCSQGRADVVSAVVKKAVGTKKWDSRLMQNPSSAQILSLLSVNFFIEKDALQARANCSERTFNKQLSELIECELIIEGPDGRLRLSHEFPRHGVEIHSYEMKLKNWKRALYQATQYKAFSHKTSVVIPSRGISNALPHIELFKLNNVGLVEFCPTGDLVVHVRPKRETPKSKKLFITALGKVLGHFERVATH